MTHLPQVEWAGPEAHGHINSIIRHHMHALRTPTNMHMTHITSGTGHDHEEALAHPHGHMTYLGSSTPPIHTCYETLSIRTRQCRHQYTYLHVQHSAHLHSSSAHPHPPYFSIPTHSQPCPQALQVEAS